MNFRILDQMPSYAKFMIDILSNEIKLKNNETVMMIEECSAIFQHKLRLKLKDIVSFIVPCNIGNKHIYKVLRNLGASINLLPLSLSRKLGLGKAKATKFHRSWLTGQSNTLEALLKIFW